MQRAAKRSADRLRRTIGARTIRSVGQSARQRTLSERPRGDQVACDAVASIERPHAIEGDVLTRRSRARRACAKSASALTRP